MERSLFIKRITFLGVCASLLSAVNFVLITGLVEPLDSEKTAHAAAEEQALFEEKPEQNLTVKSLILTSKSADGRYLKGQNIEAVCTIENSSSKTIGAFTSILRTSEKEVATKKTAQLKPGETVTLKGTFSSENNAILYTACRTDIDEKIPELNERDNSEVKAIYVL